MLDSRTSELEDEGLTTYELDLPGEQVSLCEGDIEKLLSLATPIFDDIEHTPDGELLSLAIAGLGCQCRLTC